MPLSSDQKFVIQKLLDTAVIASSQLKFSLEGVEEFLNSVSKFVFNNHKRLGNHPYLFLLSTSATKNKAPLNFKTVNSSIKSGEAIFVVTPGLNLVSTRKMKATATNCSIISENENTLGLRIEGSFCYEYLCGKIRGEGNLLDSKAGAPVISIFHQPMEKFNQILDDHYENDIKNEKGTQYWHNKAKRILLSIKNQTEYIFQLSLINWLRLYVKDKLDVYGEPVKLGQDKIDIVVVTYDGKYAIEIKWLGINSKGTTCDGKEIDSGLAQIKIYLQNNTDIVEGYLVAYDGRSLNDHKNKSGFKEKNRHHLCEPPKIIFLESESPSKSAKKIGK